MAITLIKEDGSGLSTANTYADLDDLTTAAELLGEDLSSYDDEAQKSALYVASNKYIDRLHSFKGDKVSDEQSMKLYTDEVTYDEAGADIAQAACEAAILQLKGYLFVDPTTQSTNGNVISESKELDVLKKSTTYEEGTRVTTKYSTSTIDELLKPYLSSQLGSAFMRVT